MKRIAVVFGTRPEAIKMIPVVRALRQSSAFETIVLTTGQHRQMLDQVFATFDERPDVDLDLMQPQQTLADITANVVRSFSRTLDELKPDLVLVHGDTTTAMAAAMAAFYKRIRIGHVEAGLRSFDLDRPWPEEFNRVVIDAVAEFAFAPTASSRDNLLGEYNKRARIYVTGNTGIDALLYVSRLIDSRAPMIEAVERRYAHLDRKRHLVLVTGHRRESFGAGFQQICDGLIKVASRGDVELLYPVHLNPQVDGVVRDRLAGIEAIKLIPPVDYVDMVYLMKRAKLVITDSGGIQEEGPALGKPVLVLRDVTERPEALETGVVRLVGTAPDALKAVVDRLLDDPATYEATARAVFPYGNGTAAQQIRVILEGELGK